MAFSLGENKRVAGWFYNDSLYDITQKEGFIGCFENFNEPIKHYLIQVKHLENVFFISIENSIEYYISHYYLKLNVKPTWSGPVVIAECFLRTINDKGTWFLLDGKVIKLSPKPIEDIMVWSSSLGGFSHISKKALKQIATDLGGEVADKLKPFGNSFEFFSKTQFEKELKIHGLIDKQGEIEEIIKKAEGCFIASATYGDHNHPTIIFLRHFRNSVLSTHPVGITFIKHYYHISPTVANLIKKHPSLIKLSMIILENISRLLMHIFERHETFEDRASFQQKLGIFSK